MRLTTLVFLLCAQAAFAKPWNGIEPGVSTKADVVQKFGPPSKAVAQNGKDVLAYMGPKAIRGTSQAQFKFDPKTEVVQRIDVFPKATIEKAAIESTYGEECPATSPPTTTCYQKRVTKDYKVYFVYPRLGLAVFFKEDGKTVDSLIFQPGAK